MTSQDPGQVTRILNELGGGDRVAAGKLLPLVYEELRALAAVRMGNEASGQTLDPTALVHEAYLRLVGDDQAGATWENRGHFFAAAAESMRRIMIDRARRYRAEKHGGGRRPVPLDEARAVAVEEDDADVMALDEALTRLEAEDPVRGEVVKLRYFGGLTIKQTADVMNLSQATVSRHWTYARTWLYQEMQSPDGGKSGSNEGPGGTFSH